MGDFNHLKALCKKKPYLVYSYDFMNKTALHWSILRNQTECAKYLIVEKSYINAQDALGKHALFYAIQNNNPEIVYILLNMKVSPYILFHQRLTYRFLLGVKDMGLITISVTIQRKWFILSKSSDISIWFIN